VETYGTVEPAGLHVRLDRLWDDALTAFAWAAFAARITTTSRPERSEEIAMETTTIPAVHRRVTVNAPAERAFTLFTREMGTWWPMSSHHIGAADCAQVRVDEEAGGRWYEVGVDGSECDWGRVLAWDPPHRVVLSWQIDGNWAYDPDPGHASEVEVTFTAQGPDVTLVEVRHRHFERHGATGAAVGESVAAEGGWGTLLTMYADRA
jgi:uncharacterized protein YndB with AHSA1/START domain